MEGEFFAMGHENEVGELACLKQSFGLGGVLPGSGFASPAGSGCLSFVGLFWLMVT